MCSSCGGSSSWSDVVHTVLSFCAVQLVRKQHRRVCTGKLSSDCTLQGGVRCSPLFTQPAWCQSPPRTSLRGRRDWVPRHSQAGERLASVGSVLNVPPGHTLAAPLSLMWAMSCSAHAGPELTCCCEGVDGGVLWRRYEKNKVYLDSSTAGVGKPIPAVPLSNRFSVLPDELLSAWGQVVNQRAARRENLLDTD